MPPIPVVDPTQLLIQTGGLGMAAFLVIYLTRTQADILKELIAAIRQNADILLRIEDALKLRRSQTRKNDS